LKFLKKFQILQNNLQKPGQLASVSLNGEHIQNAAGYFGDKETEEENKKLKEKISQSARIIEKLEIEVKSLREQLDDFEIEKGEITREKDMFQIKLEALYKAYQNKGKESEGEDDEDSEIDFTDLEDLSAIGQYREKNEKLEKVVKDKETKLKLLQNE